MAVTQIIKLDLNNHKADDIIIRVGESYTRKVVFIPGTYDGDDFTPTEFYGREEGPRAMFRMVKPDRTFVLQNLTVVHEEPDTGVYSFELVPDEYMSQVAGIGYYDLRINDSDTDEEFLYTVQGRVLIDDDMITDSMIESVAAANDMIFPDDFLTIDDFNPNDYATKQYVIGSLEDYATKQYVDDAIAEIPDTLHIYSTTEQLVGKWYGDIDLYEKSYIMDPLTAPGDSILDNDISNINIVDYDIIYNGNANQLTKQVTADTLYKDGSNRLIYYTNGTGALYRKAIIIVRYTKL